MKLKLSRRASLLVFATVLLVGAAGFTVFKLTTGQDVQSASDCTSVEKYDAASRSCYYECNTDAECAAIEAQIDREVNQYFASTTTKAPKQPATQASNTASNGRTNYKFENGAFTPVITDANESKYAKLFVAIAGQNFAKTYLNQASFFNDSSNDVAASVVQDESDSTKWNLEVNMAYADNEQEMVMTLVHEYAHVFSLNKEQVDGGVSGSCPQLSISEGCANKGSFIDGFNGTFWAQLHADPDANNFGQYYAGREGDFVSEYAATNALEDFAETFAYATLKDTNSLSGVAKQKVQFMQQNETISKRMSEIKTSLATNLRARKVLQ